MAWTCPTWWVVLNLMSGVTMCVDGKGGYDVQGPTHAEEGAEPF
jgi:hypothetical protein